ncbi:response regulator [bacterium]|nr:MAG: response regulator [bacterium]
MRLNISLGQRLLVLIAIPLAMVVMLVLVFWDLQRSVASANAWESHSYAVLAQSASADASLQEAQSGVRTYLLTGDARFTQAYGVAVRDLPGSLRGLQAMVSDNVGQTERAQRIASLAYLELACLRRELDLRRHGASQQQLAAAIRGACTGAAEQFGDGLRAFNAEELVLKANREASLQTARDHLVIAVALAAIAVVLVTLLLGMLFMRSVVRRLTRVAEKARELASGESAPHVHETHDEVALLEAIVDAAVQAVREREALSVRYRLLVEQARDLIIFVGRSDGRIRDVNPAAVAEYGYARDEFLRLTIRDLRTAEAEKALGPFASLSEEYIQLYESEHRRKDGSTFPVESRSHIVEIDGESVVLSINRDITERNRAAKALANARDKALEASRLKSEFVATMSHEIRTPMNGVIAMAELLAGTDLDVEQQEYARTIKESGEALLRIINEILDFSKVEAGKLDLDIQTCSLARVVEGTAQLVASAGSAKGLEVVSYVDPAIPPAVNGDAGRLRQVLINMVGNAIKFTEQGYVVVRAVRIGERHRVVEVRFEVEDTGIGIPPHLRERLFEPFAQADGSTTRRYGGTGLGLAISKRLVELMGGEIGVRSEPGRGSTFWFCLPLERASDEGAPLRLAAFHEVGALVTGIDGPALSIIERYLASWGVECRRDPDVGRASVEAAELSRAGRPFDLAVLDIGLARPDEEWVRGAIAALRREVRDVILVAQPDMAGEGPDLARIGLAAYLTKPLRQSALFDCLASLLVEHDSETPHAYRSPAAPSAGSVSQTMPIVQHEAVVLLAEDNAINQRVALNQLRKIGVAAVVVENGRQAVDAAAGGGFAAVLMDCQMPEMDGFEATRAIRRMETRTGGHIPIIAMTANALEEDRRACIAAGMDDYISKPVAFSDLHVVLQRWLPGGATRAAVEGSEHG